MKPKNRLTNVVVIPQGGLMLPKDNKSEEEIIVSKLLSNWEPNGFVAETPQNEIPAGHRQLLLQLAKKQLDKKSDAEIVKEMTTYIAVDRGYFDFFHNALMNCKETVDGPDFE